MPAMRISKPSPAMVVACTALFIALGGTSIAAVNYARNAGKVDGRDAVGAGASNARAAGKLVATLGRGSHRGQLPPHFVAQVPRTTPFGRFMEVSDNATGAPLHLVGDSGFAAVSATCSDQNRAPGVENPIVAVTVTNQSGGPLNLASRRGGAEPTVIEFPNATAQTFHVGAQTTIELLLQKPDGNSMMIDAGARQAGQQTAAAACHVFGTALRIIP
jgi:hypothetical protein